MTELRFPFTNVKYVRKVRKVIIIRAEFEDR